MKTIKFTIALFATTLLFTSCKDEKKEQAVKDVEQFTTYVDSISKLDMAEARTNWVAIENDYVTYKNSVDANLNGVADKQELESDVNEATVKFEDYKAQLAQQEQQALLETKNNFRTSLLGKNYINDDMKFEWINKDNILSVYQNFVDTVSANKDTYSREDWDEIKLLYEAIDTRKNTVEKEGLTSKDNLAIAGLKLKFAPMYELNRMGAKSEENAEAKNE